MPSDESPDGPPDAPRASTRAVLAVGILAGIVSFAFMWFTAPEQVGLASNVYLRAGEALLAGENVYEVSPPGLDYYYLYPPIVTLLFVPHALVGSSLVAFAVQTALNVAASVGTAAVIYRALRRRGVALERLDFALLAGFVLTSAYAAIPLINGQVTHWLTLAFAVGFDGLDRRRESLAGAAFAGAALIKVFPAAIGLWLLRRRAWRAVGVAVLTGLGGLLLGAVLFGPDLTVTYFSDVLVGRYTGSSFDGTPTASRNVDGIRRQLAALLDVGRPVRTVLSAAILAPFLAVLYKRVDTDGRRQAAALGTVVATLLFLPLQPMYSLLFVFPLSVLLYRLPAGRPRAVLLVGVLWSYLAMGYEEVTIAVAAVPLSGGVSESLLAVAEAAFTVILPPTVGLWLILVACVLVARDSQLEV
ncbi:glycosyltransferase family 87 protein [Natronomonas amylolytica]|uniref:glycosyltransferase family 87 protein n=1 Tax=Natronomonas amylolytica TaxID=3108498 RepID=UPI003008A3E1